jgi:DNA-binding response OmpR family regulator
MTCRVLVIDDEDELRASVCELLLEEGFSSIVARNGKEGLDFLRSCDMKPCLILLDIMMPVMSGYEFLERIAKDRTLCPIPIVIMSALDNVAVTMETFGMSARAVLRKPFDIDELLTLVTENCRRPPTN